LAGELLAAGLVLRVSPRSAGTTPPDTGPFTITLGKAEVIATLEIADDGVGFDAPQVRADPPERHSCSRVVPDGVYAQADLRVASAPGSGTAWQLTVLLP
jgi:hypothetical protein